VGKDVVVALVRSSAGAVLVVAGLSKLLHLSSFAETLTRFPLSRLILRQSGSARAGALVLSLFEVATGSLFVVGIALPAVGSLMLLLLLGFTAGTLIAILRKEQVACGCFGSGGTEPVGWISVVRNVLLIAGVVTGLLYDGLSLQEVLEGQVSLGRYLLTMAVPSLPT